MQELILGLIAQPNIPSLLSQLLDNDVLNENSCILQCLQYIIDEELIPAPDSLKKNVLEESESESESERESESEESESEESESESESENEGNNESENENNENKEKETNIITETNSNTPTNQEAIKTENSLSTIQEE